MALDVQQLEQRNRAAEAAAEEQRRIAAEAQRVLRAQLEDANAAARGRVEAEREKDRLEDQAALEWVVAKQRAEIARQQAAESARRDRDRAYAALLLSSRQAASSAADEDERKARLAREAAVLAQRARDRATSEQRAAFMRCARACPTLAVSPPFSALVSALLAGPSRRARLPSCRRARTSATASAPKRSGQRRRPQPLPWSRHGKIRCDEATSMRSAAAVSPHCCALLVPCCGVRLA